MVGSPPLAARATAVLLSSLLAPGCASTMGERLPAMAARAPTSALDLEPMRCEDAVRRTRDDARAQAKSWLTAARHAYREACRGPTWADGDCLDLGAAESDSDGYGYDFCGDPLAAGSFGPNDAGVRVRPGPVANIRVEPGRSASRSTTNVQVPGVDEPDTIDTDGRHLFVARGRELWIVRGLPAVEARVVARVPLEGRAAALFHDGDTVVAFAQLREQGEDATRVAVIDVSDPARPRTARTLRISGRFVAARRIGTAVHVVVAEPRVRATPRWLPPRLCRPDIDDVFDRIEADMLAAIEAETSLPWVESMRFEGDEAHRRVDCNRYGRSDGHVQTSVVSFDVRGGEPSMVTALVEPDVVYASARGLYLVDVLDAHAHHALGQHHSSTRDAIRASAIHRFRLHDGPAPSARYAGSALVAGQPVSSFALDEHDGALRVAATDPGLASTLTVLDAPDDGLSLRSYVGGVAPDEDIRSVRFVGDRAYVVTFRVVDPLFVFDLGGREPVALGELKIPGFATYIHPLGADRLLTIGRHTETTEAGGVSLGGVRLQLVDVADPAHPQLTNHDVIDRATSEAQHDHHAFTYLPERELLVLPLDIESGFRGLAVYQAGPRSGLAPRARVSTPRGWQSVERVVVMDDVLFALREGSLDVHRLGDDDALARVELRAN